MTGGQGLKVLLGRASPGPALLLLTAALPREGDAHRLAPGDKGARLVAVLEGVRALAARCDDGAGAAPYYFPHARLDLVAIACLHRSTSSPACMYKHLPHLARNMRATATCPCHRLDRPELHRLSFIALPDTGCSLVEGLVANLNDPETSVRRGAVVTLADLWYRLGHR